MKRARNVDYIITVLRKLREEIGREVDKIELMYGAVNKPLLTLLGVLKV